MNLMHTINKKSLVRRELKASNYIRSLFRS